MKTLLIRALFMAILLTFGIAATVNGGQPVHIEQPPITTEDPGGDGLPFDPNQPADPTETGEQPPFDDLPVDQPPIDAEVTPEPTPEPDPAEIEAQANALRIQQISISARHDLELLADATLTGSRPEGWSGSRDSEDPQYPLLIRLDLELLAGTLYGQNVRPAGWFGVVGSTPFALARDLRHDVELLADERLGEGVARPAGWLGGEPLMLCDRATQGVVEVLELNGVFTLQADRTAPDFCEQATIEVSVFMETNLLANPSGTGGVLAPGISTPGTSTVTENFAVAFLDRGAGRRAGVIPVGVPIQPVARSYAQFSAMMLVRGENFEVFVDYNTTSVTPDEFDALPNIDEGAVSPFCGAEWCEVAG